MSVLRTFFKIFLVLSPFLLDPDPYQSSPWIRNEFFHILDSDLYQNDTDPPHCRYISSYPFIPIHFKASGVKSKILTPPHVIRPETDFHHPVFRDLGSGASLDLVANTFITQIYLIKNEKSLPCE